MQANELSDCGPRVSAVAVESHPSNLHLTCESPLYQLEKAIVPTDALALQYHDPELERATMILPPVAGGPSAQPVSPQTSSVRALVGQQANPMPVQSFRDSPYSVDHTARGSSCTYLCLWVAAQFMFSGDRWMRGTMSASLRQPSLHTHSWLELVAPCKAMWIHFIYATATVAHEDRVRLEAGDREGHHAGGASGVPRSFGPGSGPSIEEVNWDQI